MKYKLAVSMIVIIFYGIITLFGSEIGEIPNHFADKVAFLVHVVKGLKILGHEIHLVVFRPNVRRILLQ